MQRVPEVWPILHLEAAPPSWRDLTVDGLVTRRLRLDLDALAAIGVEHRRLAVHCVWGWSRTDPTWTGVPLGRVLERCEPASSFVTVRAASGVYSSCLPLVDAADGFLAWARDGERLPPEAGGPLRFLPPPGYWGYKGVKWAARVTVVDRFVPGTWETKVSDPEGRIPPDVELP